MLIPSCVTMLGARRIFVFEQALSFAWRGWMNLRWLRIGGRKCSVDEGVTKIWGGLQTLWRTNQYKFQMAERVEYNIHWEMVKNCFYRLQKESLCSNGTPLWTMPINAELDHEPWSKYVTLWDKGNLRLENRLCLFGSI